MLGTFKDSLLAADQDDAGFCRARLNSGSHVRKLWYENDLRSALGGRSRQIGSVKAPSPSVVKFLVNSQSWRSCHASFAKPGVLTAARPHCGP